MTELKPEGGGSWWTTLPGILTGVAAVVTALGGLITAAGPYFTRPRPPDDKSRQEAISQGLPLPARPSPTAPQRVDGVWIGNLEVRRSVDRGTASIDLYYRVSTGAGYVRHDPSRFVRMVSDGRAIAPSWAPPAVDMPARSEQDIKVVFNTSLAGPILFRFGEEKPVDIPLR